MSQKKEALRELLECTWRPDLKVMILITHTAVGRHALGDYRETIDNFRGVLGQFGCLSMTQEEQVTQAKGQC